MLHCGKRRPASQYNTLPEFFFVSLQGNSPQAAAIAQKIEKKLEELNNKLQNGVIAQVAEDFMDTTTNLKQLEKAARAPPGNGLNYSKYVKFL